MHKTLSISIGNEVFTIHEDAYAALKTYLDAVNAQFREFEDANDIVSDIEERISELLKEELRDGEKVVTDAHVRKVVAIMGEAQDIGDAAEEDAASTPKTEKHGAKRLYRDTENGVIAGVCAGIAEYFGVDRTLVRVVFLIAFLSGAFSGFAFLAYLILWIVTPEAKSLAEKMEMRGEPVTLEHIEETVRAAVKKGGEAAMAQKPKAQRAGRQVLEALDEVFRTLGKAFWKFAHALKGIAGALAIFVGVALAIASIAGLIAVIFGFTVLMISPGSVSVGFPFEVLGTGSEYVLLVVTAFITAAIPLLVIFLLAVSLVRRKGQVTLGAAIGLLVLWFVAVSVAAVFGMRSAPALQDAWHDGRMPMFSSMRGDEEAVKSVDIKAFETLVAESLFEIELAQGDAYGLTLEGDENDLDDVIVDESSGELRLKRKPRFTFCIFCFHHDIKATLTVVEWPKSIELSGATSLNADGIESQDMRLEISGASSARLTGAIEEVDMDISGASRVTLIGQGVRIVGDVSGASELKALDFPVDDAVIEVSGASKASLEVASALDADVSGASSLSYRGEAETTMDVSGASHMRKIDTEPSATE